MIVKQLKAGFYAVPFEAVTLNGMPLVQLNTLVEPYDGPWALISPGLNRAIDNDRNRPYRYRTLSEAMQEVDRLLELGEWSCCGGVVREPQVKPLTKRTMGLRELRKRTRDALKAVRKHLRAAHYTTCPDEELIAGVIEPLLTDIAQDIEMEKILAKQKGGE